MPPDSSPPHDDVLSDIEDISDANNNHEGATDGSVAPAAVTPAAVTPHPEHSVVPASLVSPDSGIVLTVMTPVPHRAFTDPMSSAMSALQTLHNADYE